MLLVLMPRTQKGVTATFCLKCCPPNIPELLSYALLEKSVERHAFVSVSPNTFLSHLFMRVARMLS